MLKTKLKKPLFTIFFDKEPCCTLGPNKSACWTQAGREKFLQARLESQELDKKEGDVAVLASLRVMRSLPSTSQEGSRSSIKYQFGGVPICKMAFLFLNALGARRLKNLITHYDSEGFECPSTRKHKETPP